MRSNDEILKEVREQCAEVNCQSLNVICNVAMEKAIEECKEEIIAQLVQLSNNYEVIGSCYVIQKIALDNYVYDLEFNK